MIKKIITEYLTEEGFVVKVTEVFLFNICLYRCEDATYDNRKVSVFKKSIRNKIGYETEDKSTKNK